MRTFFIKQAAWEWLRYGIIATVLVCLCANFTTAQTVNLYGDTGFNSIYYPEVHNGHIYALGADNINGNLRESHFLKMDMTGNIVWQARLKAGTAINDFTTDGNGTFVMTGRTGDTRRAVVWKLKDQGTSYATDCIKYFQLAGGRQGFNYVAYRSNTNDYLLHAVNLNSGDDVGLHTLDNDCNISSSRRYEGNFDHQFANGLMQDVSNNWTMMGDNGSNGHGVFVTVNGSLDYQEAFELRPSVNGRSDLRRGVLEGNNKIMVGHAGSTTRGIILEVAPGGNLKWAMEIPQSTYLLDIHKGATNGNITSYYVMGEAVVNGLTRWVLHKLDKQIGQKPSLVWTKMLDQNESEFSGGFPTYDQVSGQIVYTDARKGNANGFADMDALFAVLDKDFNSCITKELEHTLIDFELSLARINLDPMSIDIPQYIEGSQTEPVDYESEKLCASTNVCENNYFQNGDFEQVTGDPSASTDQDIDLAVGWSRVWNNGSVADLADGGTTHTSSMTAPVPNTGVHAGFWITNDWNPNRGPTSREAMYNWLNTTIPQNSGSYDLSFKMANSMLPNTFNNQPYEIAIYGVHNPSGSPATTPSGMFIPADLDLWGTGSGLITLLGTVTIPVGITQNWQVANLTFNAVNAPSNGITHIMITRGETLASSLSGLYMNFDDFCLQRNPCEPSTNLNCDLVDYNYTGSNGQLRYSFSVPSGTASGRWTATGGAYGNNQTSIGNGTTVNYTFPSTGTYTICYRYTDADGCERICCKTICLTGDPYNCNLIQSNFDQATGTWTLTAAGTSAADIDYWQNDITFQRFGSGSVSVSVPNPSVGQFGYYSVKVFDAACGGYKVCCLRVPHQPGDTNACGRVNTPSISCDNGTGLYTLNFTVINNSGRSGTVNAEVSLLTPFGIGYQGCAASVQTITNIGGSQFVSLNIEDCFASLSAGTTVRYKVTLRDPNSDWCCHFDESTIAIPSCDGCPSDCPSDPLNSLPWLSGISGNAEVYQCKLDGKCVYRVSDCATADGLTTLYDCNGQIICQDGGIAGNQCAEIARLTDCRVVKSCSNDDCFGTPDPNIFCPQDYTPVCGCDDMTYSNECEAQRAGILSWTAGECGGNNCNGTNLVKNGDFEGGNWAFTSNLPQKCYCAAASYCIQANAMNKCNSSLWKNITSSGKYMIIDGDSGSNFSVVWKQDNINVAAGSSYEFGFDHHPNLSGGDAPTLVVQINGVTVSQNLKGTKDIWNTFTDSWTANSNRNISLRIVQVQAGAQYNDYGIDNIVFKACNSNFNGSVESRGIEVEEAITLTNFPNPFQNSTTIAFELPTEMEASLRIFDMKGREVFTKTATFQAGETRIEVDATTLHSAGLYYYRLETAKEVITKSMLLISK